MDTYEILDFKELNGKVLKSVQFAENGMSIQFKTADNEEFRLKHQQAGTEHVRFDEKVGDIENIINTPILHADTAESDSENALAGYDKFYITFMIKTAKGSVKFIWSCLYDSPQPVFIDFIKILDS